LRTGHVSWSSFVCRRNDHFSDVLCIRAYGGQVRLDELARRLPDQLGVTYRFILLFGDTKQRIGKGWGDRCGFAGRSSLFRAAVRIPGATVRGRTLQLPGRSPSGFR